MTVVVLGAAVFIPMLVEAYLAARHDTQLRRLGAVEPADDVIAAMQVAYPLAFIAMLGESVLGRPAADAWVAAGAAIFIAAKALKYWAIATLGTRWTFRVLVPPGSSRIVRGPYRFMTHPNYAAVTGELAGVALMAHALITGPLVTLAFVVLMRRRIAVEERALGMRPVESPR